MTSPFRQTARSLCTALALPAVLHPGGAGPVADRVKTSGTVRVCIWPDYDGTTFRSPRAGQLGGIDIELSAEFAKGLGVKLQYVETSFAKLIDDIGADPCDVAMFAVGITPQRLPHLRFAQPCLKSDVHGVTTRANRAIRNWTDIDQPGVNVAVPAGIFMEPMMVAALDQAQMVVVTPPLVREQELEAGRVDIFMTDHPCSRRLLDNADWARLVSLPQPFHPIPCACAVRSGDDDWLREVDRLVAEIKRDGRLDAAARRVVLSEIVVKQ